MRAFCCRWWGIPGVDRYQQSAQREVHLPVAAGAACAGKGEGGLASRRRA